MTHYQSINAAARLNDLLHDLGWDRRGLHAFPTGSRLEVAVQYKSEACGRARVVACDPDKLCAWICKNRAAHGVLAKLFSMLERKPELEGRLVQPALFSPADLPSPVRRSMSPNE